MIRVAHADGVVTTLLDRPEARNALPTTGWRLFADMIAAVPDDAQVVVIRSSSAGIFCSGADLNDLARLADRPEERAVFRHAMRAAIDGLAALPMPTIAVIEGGCFGAGVALALAADLRIASPAARFAVPPARLGIGYPAEDVARLAARTGQGAAARLLFTADTIDANEALRIGLVDQIGDADNAVAAIVGNDPAALRLIKRMLGNPADPGHAEAFEDSFGSAAFRAGLARFHGRAR